MATDQEHAVSEDVAKRNLQRTLAQKAASGRAVEKKETHKKRVRHKRRKGPGKKVEIDFSKLKGPAGAGQRGGGSEAPKLYPTMGKKTNVPQQRRTPPPKTEEGK